MDGNFFLPEGQRIIIILKLDPFLHVNFVDFFIILFEMNSFNNI